MDSVPPSGGSGEGTGAGGLLTTSSVTLAAVVGEFLATRGNLQTRRAYGAALEGFFRTAGITQLAELHPEVRPPSEVAKLVRTYLDAVTKRAETEPKRVVNPATVNARAEALRAFFAWLMPAYGYPVNPLTSAHTSLKTARVSSAASLTRGELADLLQAMSGAAAAGRVVPEKRITPQGLRKTFIELALAEGEPLEAISNATGHARPELLNYYAGGRKLRENAIHKVAGKYL